MGPGGTNGNLDISYKDFVIIQQRDIHARGVPQPMTNKIDGKSPKNSCASKKIASRRKKLASRRVDGVGWIG
jgi:hypothetical protein